MVPPAAAASAALHGALLESRQRWQDLAGLGADLVFETDNAGRFTFLWPDTVLGYRAADLLGRRADSRHRLCAGIAHDDRASSFIISVGAHIVLQHRACSRLIGRRQSCVSARVFRFRAQLQRRQGFAV